MEQVTDDKKENTMSLTRRNMLKTSIASLALGPCALSALGKEEKKKNVYKVGGWYNGLDAFDKIKAAQLDVLQITFPLRAGEPNDFRNPGMCAQFVDKSKETGIALASIAVGNFNSFPFWQIDDAVQIVSDCIDAMVRLHIDNVLLAFFGKAQLIDDERFRVTIERLKKIAPKAEDKGVKLAIESTLNAAGHLRIIDAVNSPAVQVFYDPGNMIRRMKDTDEICSDIRKLKGLIACTHAKDSTLLGKGKIDYAKILNTYREVGYFGPLVLEGSIDRKLGMEESHRLNGQYLRTL